MNANTIRFPAVSDLRPFTIIQQSLMVNLPKTVWSSIKKIDPKFRLSTIKSPERPSKHVLFLTNFNWPKLQKRPNKKIKKSCKVTWPSLSDQGVFGFDHADRFLPFQEIVGTIGEKH